MSELTGGTGVRKGWIPVPGSRNAENFSMASQQAERKRRERHNGAHGQRRRDVIIGAKSPGRRTRN